MLSNSDYYIPSDHKNILAKIKLRLKDGKKPLPKAPKAAQIQTISGCNGDCVFCPNNKTKIKIPYKQAMKWDLYKSIIDQCISLGVRRISPYLMNEPLLDPEMPERVLYISKNKKFNQYTKINSNGSLLTEKMARGLLDSGLTKLHFSVQGIDPGNYFDLMKLQFDTVVKNIERIVELKEQGNYKKIQLRIVMLDTKDIHPHLEDIRTFWDKRGLKIHLNQMENRGHHDSIKTSSISFNKLSMFNWCNRLFRQMYVLYDGRMVQCCSDWEQSKVLGNLNDESLENIWNGNEYMSFRKKFLQGDVKGSICHGCSKDKKN